ncbi:MAG: methyl-accepting chemotaxis protein [Clostridium sp.]|nr:methyl-accepting chemotaxis protein [Clostridium sp.]MCM1172270.1 methyl-accepting chemotaxis protein [Clostridium sp.]
MKKKKFSINNMAVKAKIVTFSVVMLAFMIIIAGVGLISANRINKAEEERYDNYAMGQFYLSQAFSSAANVEMSIRNMIMLSTDPTSLGEQETLIASYKKEIADQFAKFEANLSEYSKDIVDEYEDVQDAMEEWSDSIDKQMALAKSGKSNEAFQNLMGDGAKITENAKTELTELLTNLEKEADETGEKVDSEHVILTVVIIVVAVIAVIITLIYGAMLINGISMPVAKLSEAARKLAIGDVDVDCEKIHDDDLGELMDEFAIMADGIREQVRIADVIARGDFTVDVKPRSDKDILGKSLRKLVIDENMTLNNIKEAGSQITVGSEQVASASQALAQGATEQASALEEITASMHEVTQRTKDNAEEAGEASNLVNNIKDMATTGNAHMKEMIEAMDGINQSSEVISKIIKTIDDISFQTNILALNAAVEAARAGVHGKGFAVVAEEVRSLAAKSASAAGETAEMIEDSIHKTANGTRIAEETAKSLDEIVNSIDEIVVRIGNIKVSSNDQAASISQIDQAISQVSTVVHTNAATSEESAAASEELSNQALTLKNLISNYKLTSSSGGRSSFSDMSASSSYEDTDEPIISLDGDFGKY